MWRTVIICTAIGLIDAKKATFHNYTVFRIIPSDEKHVELLRQLNESPDELTFWKEPSFVNRHVDLMVAPHKLPIFHEMMAKIKAPHEVFIEDVQALIDQTSTKTRLTSFDFENYHTLEEIYKNLDDLAKKYPDKVQTVVGGESYEGRQIKGVKVSFKANNPGIFIEGGIHAREWISPATVMYILHQLLTCNEPDVRDLAESHDWYIFPSFNPDGYVYTHTKNRLWRKTCKPYGICTGADPNRNWGYKWNCGGSSSNSCDETYRGDAPFSEIETKTLSEYICTISNKFYAYIAFHSYSQLLLLPYGHTKEHLDNYDDLYAIGEKAMEALSKKYRTRYRVGNIAELLYIASGDSVDWVKDTYNTSITYTYELRDTGRCGFLLPCNQIIPTGEETMDSLVAMFKEAKERGYPRK